MRTCCCDCGPEANATGGSPYEGDTEVVEDFANPLGSLFWQSNSQPIHQTSTGNTFLHTTTGGGTSSVFLNSVPSGGTPSQFSSAAVSTLTMFPGRDGRGNNYSYIQVDNVEVPDFNFVNLFGDEFPVSLRISNIVSNFPSQTIRQSNQFSAILTRGKILTRTQAGIGTPEIQVGTYQDGDSIRLEVNDQTKNYRLFQNGQKIHGTTILHPSTTATINQDIFAGGNNELELHPWGDRCLPVLFGIRATLPLSQQALNNNLTVSIGQVSAGFINQPQLIHEFDLTTANFDAGWGVYDDNGVQRAYYDTTNIVNDAEFRLPLPNLVPYKRYAFAISSSQIFQLFFRDSTGERSITMSNRIPPSQRPTGQRSGIIWTPDTSAEIVIKAGSFNGPGAGLRTFRSFYLLEG